MKRLFASPPNLEPGSDPKPSEKLPLPSPNPPEWVKVSEPCPVELVANY